MSPIGLALALVAGVVAGTRSVAVRFGLQPQAEYVYAEGSVTCTISQCLRDDPAVANTLCCTRAFHVEHTYPPHAHRYTPTTARPRPPGALPETLNSVDVKRGLATIKARLTACREKYPERGYVAVRVVVDAAGAVESAFADPSSGDAPLDGCLVAATKRARFAPSETGVRFRYPIAR